MQDIIEGPRPFPAPLLAPCQIAQVNILDRAAGLVQSSGAIILMDATGAVTLAFEVHKKLRDTIYGEVRAGIRLTPSSDTPNTYERNMAEVVAIKVSNKARLAQSTNPAEDPLKEIAVYQYMSPHPNVLLLIAAAEDARNVYTITEYCGGGEFFDFIKNYGALDEATAKRFFTQIVNGYSHVKQHYVVHRDLSLENILLTTDRSSCKIMDFGMALSAPINAATGAPRRMPRQGIVGKKNYMSPETLEQAVFFGHLVDVWALGVILFIMLTGYPPVEVALPTDARYLMIREGNMAQMLANWGISISPLAIDLMNRILRDDPLSRLSVDDILAHPWMRS